MLYKQYEVTYRLGSDAIIGSGMGGEFNIDLIVQRDKAGFPFIPSTVFRGILRHAADNMKLPNIGELFGQSADTAKNSPKKRSPLIITSFYIPDEFKTGQQPDDFVFLRSQTSLLNDHRVPDENTLRTVELIRMGTEFKGTILVPDSFDGIMKDLLSRVRFVGHNQSKTAGMLLLLKITKINKAEISALSANSSDNCIRLFVKNYDPVCLPESAVSDNLLTTETYLSGRRVHGAIVSALIGSGADNALVEKLFSGEIHVYNGYPCSEMISSIYPQPVVIQKYKNKNGYKNKLDSKDQEKSSRPQDFDFCSFNQDGLFMPHSAKMRIAMRNQIKNGEKSVLYSEEQLVESQFFPLDIKFKDNNALSDFCKTKFKDILNGSIPLRVGRSGRLFEIVKIETFTAKEKVHFDNINELRIFFKSDAIIRDYETNCLLVSLKEIDQVASLLNISSSNISKIDDSNVEFTTTSGFNPASQFLMPQKPAVKKGSVLVVKLNSSMSISLDSQIGEEKEFGFGEIENLDAVFKGFSQAESDIRIVSSAFDSVTKEWLQIEGLKKQLKGLSKSHLHFLKLELEKVSKNKLSITDLEDTLQIKKSKLGAADIKKVFDKEESITNFLKHDVGLLLKSLRYTIASGKEPING